MMMMMNKILSIRFQFFKNPIVCSISLCILQIRWFLPELFFICLLIEFGAPNLMIEWIALLLHVI